MWFSVADTFLSCFVATIHGLAEPALAKPVNSSIAADIADPIDTNRAILCQSPNRILPSGMVRSLTRNGMHLFLNHLPLFYL